MLSIKQNRQSQINQKVYSILFKIIFFFSFIDIHILWKKLFLNKSKTIKNASKSYDNTCYKHFYIEFQQKTSVEKIRPVSY